MSSVIRRHGRRGFIKLCMGAFTTGGLRHAFASSSTINKYNQVELVGANKTPILESGIKPGQSYIFHYPYISTPCFLIDLGESVVDNITLTTTDGGTYKWTGGVGPNQSIVAFSAICAHKMTHPAKSVSFINYRADSVSYQDKNRQTQEGSKLIYCCSERSVYDVTKGAKVLGGPAPQPLTAILLNYNSRNQTLHAVGTIGGEMYKKYFAEFTPRLQLEYLVTDVNVLVTGNTEVVQNEAFSRTNMMC